MARPGKKVKSKPWAVYTVIDRGEEKDPFWCRLGVGFKNRDGSFNIYLNANPINGELHLRLPEDKESEDSGEAGETVE